MEEINLSNKINELINEAVQSFKDTADNFESLFEQGTQLEILSNAGKNHVNDSLVSTITTTLKKAKSTSRNILIEKNVISCLVKKEGFDAETTRNLSERESKLQLEYEKSHKEVIRLENLLNKFTK